VLLAALSTGHKIGLAVVGGAFILFALTSSFVLPRRRPDFPGKNGLSVFVLVCFVFFFAMLTAVIVFGVESEAKGAAEKAPGKAAAPASSVSVTETEFKIALPAAKVGPGKITFAVKNAGKIQHDLVVSGTGVSAAAKTPLIDAGASAKVTVTLAAGSYTLYCSVPGHRAAGMVTKLTVG
jgi:uncharacterized cupredoxin-like copper-binding protein